MANYTGRPAKGEKMSTEEIKTIIPCSGEWIAKYKNTTTEEEEEYPIACWAIIIDHLNEEEQKEFGLTQFEFIRGLMPMLGDQNLVTPFEELSDDHNFIGYERVIQKSY